MTRSAWAMTGATVAGLAVALWTLDRVGLRDTFAVLAGIGLGGLALFLLAYATVLIALGFAWSSSSREGSRRALTFAWARTVREAANDLLPFSQIGGLVVGVKVLIDAGVAPARAYAATVIDLVTEMASQILLVLSGVAIAIELLADKDTDPKLQAMIWAGTAVLTILFAGLMTLRGPVLAFAGRMAEKVVPAAGARIAEVRAELAAFESSRFAMLPSFLWNALAWLLAIFTVWLALLLLGHPLPSHRVLALEALISVVRSGAFVIPGAIGVQEAGYALLGPLFGLDPRTAMALALLKRGRDLLVGVPTLLIWQMQLIRAKKPMAVEGEI